MIYALPTSKPSTTGIALVKAITSVLAIGVYLASLFWLWFYTMVGFEIVNVLDGKAKILLWMLIVSCSGFIAYAATLLIFRLCLGKKKRDDAHISVFILWFYATAGVFLGVFLAHVGTVFFMNDGEAMGEWILMGVALAATALWFPLRQMVKCWQGAKLP